MSNESHQVSPSPLEPSSLPSADLVLLRRWIAGDRNAANRLSQRYYNQLCRYFRRIAPGQDPVELTQDTFMQLCVSANSALTAKTNFRAYLFGIARNVLNQHLRRTYRQHELQGVLEQHEQFDEQTPATLLMDVRARAALLKLLATLPETSRALLQAFYWDGRTAEQLGGDLGLPAATVRTRLHYCKRRLRAALQDELGIGAGAESDLGVQVKQLRGLLCDGPYRAEYQAH